MRKVFLWILLILFAVFVATTLVIVIVARTQTVTVIGSKAQAWVWVAPELQPQLVEEMRAYARERSLKFESTQIPASWNMISLKLITPKGNEMELINATGRDQYSATIMVFHENEDWQSYWKDLRAYLNTRYKWKDLP